MRKYPFLHYRRLFDREMDSGISPKAKEMLEDIAFCENESFGGVLIVGINPSKNDKLTPRAPHDYSFRFKENVLDKPGRGIWRRVNQMFDDGTGLKEDLAYLDLFPIRCTRQSEFESTFSKEFLREVLSITEGEIFSRAPRVILIFNKNSLKYWGSEYMGYKMRLIDGSHPRIKIYELGLKPDFNGYDEHTMVIVYGMYDERHAAKGGYKLEDDDERIVSLIKERLNPFRKVRRSDYTNWFSELPHNAEGRLEIPEGTDAIEDESLAECAKVSELIIPPSVKAIVYPRLSSNVMEELVVPPTVEKVECPITERCPSLKRATISSATNFDCNDGAIFEGCPNMEEYIVPEGDALWHTEDGVVYGEYDFGRCLVACPPKKRGVYEVKEGTRRIFEHAFNGCTGLTEIILPESVKGIYHHAFADCRNLRKLVLPSGLEFLSGRAFDNCPDELFVHKEGCRYIPSKDNECFALVGFDNGFEQIRISPDTQIIAEFVDDTLPEWDPDLGAKEILAPIKWEAHLRQYMYEKHFELIKTY